MNLFELFVKIGVDDQASGKLKDIGGRLGNGLKTAAKIGTAAVGAAAAGIAALTTAAVKNYAEYEQLVGGVDTLFKDASDKLQGYAENAYKTAGLSANQYMSTVTSFSASLISSLDGDTVAAAEAADKAITDMADNANKMGTGIDMIQNAYQGFAKQNYTMLDNLKLGYGGTKTEMERLIKDAAALSDTVDAQSMSFANIVEAIHVVQENMGIAGATALEAGTTIEGSVNSMKAAWANLVTGIADENADLETLIDNLVVSLVGDGTETNLGVFGNIFPAVETALGGIGSLVEKLAPIISEKLPGLVETVLPSLISAATSMVDGVVGALPSLLSIITSQAPKVISTIISAIIKVAPKLVTAAVEVVKTLANGISDPNTLNQVVDAAFEIINVLVSGIVDLLPQIISTGLELLVSLMLGISKNLNTIIPTVVSVILEIVDILTDPKNLSNLLSAALEIITELAFGLVDAIPSLVDAVVSIIIGLQSFLTDPENLAKILKAALDIIIALGTGLINAIPELLKGVLEVITSLINRFKETDWAQVGIDLINGIWDGLKRAWESIKSWFTNAWDTLFGGKSVDVNANVKANGSHAGGLSYVPYDGYIAQLHKGERVLTKAENEKYSGVRGGVVNVTQNIYSQAKTAADLMEEAIYQQERAVMLGA